ncbi:MAG: TrkA family potassium uptake protein [Candidatus Fermentibacteraceae bacterium]|nr:TrkA family potassium uptake protein [Candidatus Fermentibacteraceae bacterium]
MKKTPKKIAVIGLGTFGSSLADELVKQNAEVVAIDFKQELVNNISSRVDTAICFDCTNEKLLKGYGIGALDLAVVAIGENFGNTVIITKILKDLGVTVYSRASNDREEKILEAVGADKVYRPEHEQGITRAREITYSKVKEVVALRGNMELIVMEPGKLLIGKRIKELGIRRSHGINIAFLGVLRGNKEYDYVIPDPSYVLNEGDLMWLIGSTEHIRDFLGR